MNSSNHAIAIDASNNIHSTTVPKDSEFLDSADMLGYLRLLFEPSDWINLQFIHQTEKYNGGSKIDNNFMMLEEALQESTVTSIHRAQDKGWNAYVAMNAFTAGVRRRRKQDVKSVRNVYIEFDENGEIGLQKIEADVDAGVIPDPHFILQSSPEKFYVIWRVRDFTVDQQEKLNSTLQQRYGSDPASVDASRVLRLPSTRNLKYNPQPVVEIVEQTIYRRYSPDDFKIDLTAQKEANHLGKKEFPRNKSNLVPHGHIHKFMLHHAGKLRANGLNPDEIETVLLRIVHEHCQPPIDDGKVRAMAISIANFPPRNPVKDLILTTAGKTTDEASTLVLESIDENSEAAITPFDPSVINGIYQKFVELVTFGTTMAPQFAFVIAKTVIGARMAGKVKFENLDVEPRFYTALIGETGSGKGEAWRRAMQILQPRGSTSHAGQIKVVNGADSGAGIRDLFFEPPDNLPVLCYIDEVESLGNRASSTRNPAIVDQMIELADSTNISRVLAKRGPNSKAGGTKTKCDARFSMVMCGQSGDVYMKAFAGRTKLGLYDRLYPEYGTAVEAGDLPEVNPTDAFNLLAAIDSLDYSGVMTMSAECKAQLDDFWKQQPDEVRKKARWKKNLYLDTYMSAFGRGVRLAESDDAVIAIKIFIRQLVIRRVCFTTEVPDRIGYYLGLIKRITEQMERRLAAGVPPEMVAKGQRDFQKETHAHRDNEAHIFSKAWAVHCPVWLKRVDIQKSNGQIYTKYLPVTEE